MGIPYWQVYICTMELDPQTCYKRNIHNRSLEDIQVIASRFFPTPAHHIQLDATTLLQSDSIREVQMEDADDVTMEDSDVVEVRTPANHPGFGTKTSPGVIIRKSLYNESLALFFACLNSRHQVNPI